MHTIHKVSTARVLITTVSKSTGCPSTIGHTFHQTNGGIMLMPCGQLSRFCPRDFCYVITLSYLLLHDSCNTLYLGFKGDSYQKRCYLLGIQLAFVQRKPSFVGFWLLIPSVREKQGSNNGSQETNIIIVPYSPPLKVHGKVVKNLPLLKNPFHAQKELPIMVHRQHWLVMTCIVWHFS